VRGCILFLSTTASRARWAGFWHVSSAMAHITVFYGVLCT